MRQISVAGKYSYLEHSADLKIESMGKDLSESFVNQVLGMSNSLGDTSIMTGAVEKKISIKANRITSLLYDFLNELIFFIDSENLIAVDIKEFEFTSGETFEITATVVFADAKNLSNPIKSPTYNEMCLEQKGVTFHTTVVYDI